MRYDSENNAPKYISLIIIIVAILFHLNGGQLLK